jgi:molecular chaperone DnaK
MILLFAGTAVAGAEGVLSLESRTSALGGEGKLVEHVGFLTGGDGMTPILRSGKRCPCTKTVSYSTAVDGQTEIPIVVLRGTTRQASTSSLVAAVAIRGLEPRPAGFTHVRVGLHVDAEGALTISAQRAADQSPLSVVRVGPASTP